MVECPKDCAPFRVDLASGKGMPLFVPAALVDQYRKQWPAQWIEAMPNVPYTSRGITYAEWQESLKDSSEQSSEE